MRAPPRIAEGITHRRPEGSLACLCRRGRVRGLASGSRRAGKLREARPESVWDPGGALPLGSPLHHHAGGLWL
eukprot:3403019-Prorocentrum_lima.AAC.1